MHAVTLPRALAPARGARLSFRARAQKERRDGQGTAIESRSLLQAAVQSIAPQRSAPAAPAAHLASAAQRCQTALLRLGSPAPALTSCCGGSVAVSGPAAPRWLVSTGSLLAPRIALFSAAGRAAPQPGSGRSPPTRGRPPPRVPLPPARAPPPRPPPPHTHTLYRRDRRLNAARPSCRQPLHAANVSRRRRTSSTTAT